MNTTTRLGLQKPNPDPVAGDFVDVSVLNANADKIDGAISATVCTSGTRPAAPFQGQIILETDTGRVYVRLGAAWVQLLAASASSGTFVFPNDFSVGGGLSVGSVFLADGATGTMVTATTTEAVARTLASKTYKNGKAYEFTLRCQANSSVVNAAVLKLRKGTTVAGALIFDYGRVRVDEAAVDIYVTWSGIFRNISGADITTQMVLTAATTTGTCALKGFGSGPFSVVINELDGPGSAYANHPTLT